MSRKTKLIITAVVLIVSVVGYVLISPLWRSKSLDEPLPGSTSRSNNDGRDDSQKSGIRDSLDTMDTAAKTKFDQEVAAMRDKSVTGDDAMPSTDNQPKILSEALFKPRAHEVEGKALIVQVGDQQTVRFEDFKTINGPDLRIYLSAGLNNEDYIDLGAIKATAGNINYPLPPGTDINKYNNVLVWCRSFDVLFSYAEL